MAWNPKYLHNLIPGPGNTLNVWGYRDTATPAQARVTGYIADGGKRGMRVGDIVFYQQVDNQDNPTSITAFQQMVVVSVAANGAVDLSDGAAVDVTDTD